jgi:hypothetical protein
MEKFYWHTIKVVDKNDQEQHLTLDQYQEQKLRLEIADQFHSLKELACLSLIYQNEFLDIFFAYDILKQAYCYQIIPQEKTFFKKQILYILHTN